MDICMENDFVRCLQYRKKIRKSGNTNLLKKKIAILGGVTTNHMTQVLDAFLLKEGLDVEFYESEYNLFEQEILSASKTITQFNPDLLFVFTSTKNLRMIPQTSDSKEDVQNKLQDEFNRWANLLSKCEKQWNCPVIFQTFSKPEYRHTGNFDINFHFSAQSFVQKLNLMLIEELNHKNIFFIDKDYLSAQLGLKHWRSPSYWNLSKHNISFEALPYYCYNIAKAISSFFGKSKKCIVLDLDNTLWGGVIGDDGVEGIVLHENDPDGEAFLQFQEYVLSLKKRGVILAVCSKNDEENAKLPFEKHESMKLKLDDISCFVANWNPKGENIKFIAKTLNIGLESLVFFDDNPAERENVRQFVPEVTVVDVPEDPSLFIESLDRLSLFDTPSISAEDIKKTEMYKSNLQRKQYENIIGDYQKYLESLNMVMKISSFNSKNVKRVTQLINKTNQFNLTTRRYTEAQVSEMVKHNQANNLSFCTSLTDKFGDNGIITAVLCRPDKNSDKILHIDSWLMSCRVLKRDVEKALFNHICSEALERGFKVLKGEYIPTKKNSMVKDFFPELGFKKEVERENGETIWLYELEKHEPIGVKIETIIQD